MADSNITKRALAVSLKELMEELPFDKISIAQICEKCDMHRKSFYYHFQDKYDLMNWIFDTEIITVIQNGDNSLSMDAHFAFLQDCLTYFYENRSFYRKAFQVRGQNSFREHFQEFLRPLIQTRLEYVMQGNAADEFDIAIYTDLTMCVMERWLLSEKNMTPEQVVVKLENMLQWEFRVLSQMQNQ